MAERKSGLAPLPTGLLRPTTAAAPAGPAEDPAELVEAAGDDEAQGRGDATAEGKPARPHHPKALILVPTRELAMQVADALRPLAKAMELYTGTAVGGVPTSAP